MQIKHHITQVSFRRFKAFRNFTLTLRHFNIMVGPNNAGKSTVLAAFRILAAAMRKASSRKPEAIMGPKGPVLGYPVDLGSISIAEENIFFNYDESEPAEIKFRFSNQNQLLLHFPEPGSCYLIPETKFRQVSNPTTFKSSFNCPITFVPILGPVDHIEPLYEKDAARLALFNYRAARNFRNIWYHFPERFGDFKRALVQTWPGMDIEEPVVDGSHSRARLHMFCLEDRITREIFWSGFGFQVWCQMLTHIIQAKDASLFLIDEPDIYLHSDLQRQLISILRTLGPDILIATHSTEILSEAEIDDIVLINKKHKFAQRVKNPAQLGDIFSFLGSNINPILTQLAKTRKVLFLEGKDFQIIGRFARKLDALDVGNRSEFAVVSAEGFNPDRVRSLKTGMELTLGTSVKSALILDRDFRSDEQCKIIGEKCKTFCDLVKIHDRKEVENFLLVPSAIDKAAQKRLSDLSRRLGERRVYESRAMELLEQFALSKKSYVAAQFLAERRKFERINSPALHETSVAEKAFEEFEQNWADTSKRLQLIPGKEALSYLNEHFQTKYSFSLTASTIIDAMNADEIPVDIRELISDLQKFAKAG